MDADAPAMLLHDRAADGKSQARAAHRTGVRCVHLLEPLEDDLELLRRYAATMVLHLEGDFIVAGCRGGQANFEYGPSAKTTSL